MFGGAWWWRAPLLTAIANQWIVSDAPAKADAIVLLGGGLDTRPQVAARLYHEGWATRILVMQPERSPAAQYLRLPGESTIAQKLLMQEHVPESAMIVVGQSVTSTFDEANAVAAWAKEQRAHCLLVPTDLFHTRRAGWIFRRQLGQSDVEVRMIPVNARRYSGNSWWQHEEGIVNFQNEILKYFWYWFRY